MEKELQTLAQTIQAQIKEIKSKQDIENLKIKYLGKKGIISSYLEKLGTLSKEEKPKIGFLINKTKKELEALIDEKISSFENNSSNNRLDVTLPGFVTVPGKTHILTKTMDDIRKIFLDMNFQVVDGPEVETEYYNFEALNTPEWHPARDMQSTFYVDNKEKYLLRTHTSAVQIRTMEKNEPPLRIVSLGKCYRSDPLDPSHSPNFHQVEGLMIDKDINFADLKGILKVFFSKFFDKEVTLRMTPSYFPFTEPSVEVACSCVACGGKGCAVCKGSGWLEMGGAGMVDPNVFKSVKYDNEKWQGFAFGFGIERFAMIKHGINDIRHFYENDLKFLNQF